MKQHAASELRYTVELLGPDAQTVLASAGAGIEDLSGRRLEQAQLQASETTHMILLRYADGLSLPIQGYVRVTDPGSGVVTLYAVDYAIDTRQPRPRVWIEFYCHATRTA